ncbi:hypothetical protein ACQ4LE_000947 [Meloidogyne hapla]|uniref:DUF148 domain-containing protein n=1 Tax=Meloidogyne hapla TaxID=6305 RepID=A0A1I8BWI2_MELHA
MFTSKFCIIFILFLISFANLINCKNEENKDKESEPVFKFQARARLASCHHGVLVLLYLGFGEISIATPSPGGQTELEVARADHLKQIAEDLNKSVNDLKVAYNKDTKPSTNVIINCIQNYVDAYQEVQSNISSVVVPNNDRQITSSIGAMMREVAPLMAKIH